MNLSGNETGRTCKQQDFPWPSSKLYCLVSELKQLRSISRLGEIKVWVTANECKSEEFYGTSTILAGLGCVNDVEVCQIRDK